MNKTKPVIISLGEIIWDILPDGAKLGGAPLNFAWHAQLLGADVVFVSRVGNDHLGKQAVEQLVEKGLSHRFIQLEMTAPTGQALVELSKTGTPTFTILEDVAYDFIEYDQSLVPIIESGRVIYFGSLAQRAKISRSTILKYLEAAPESTLKICDINLRSPYFTEEIISQSLTLANVLKLNHEELPILAGYLGLNGDTKEQLTTLAKRFNLRVIALTRAAGGSLIYAQGAWSDFMPSPVEVVDSVGAGDAFTAALVMGMLKGKDLQTINQHANDVAGYVCTQAGATPNLPPELIRSP